MCIPNIILLRPLLKQMHDSRDDKRYTEKKNKSERARRKKDDTARLRGIVDAALSVDPRIKRIKQEEKAARDAKKKTKGGVNGAMNAKQKAEEDKRKAEEEAKKKEEDEKVRVHSYLPVSTILTSHLFKGGSCRSQEGEGCRCQRCEESTTAAACCGGNRCACVMPIPLWRYSQQNQLLVFILHCTVFSSSSFWLRLARIVYHPVALLRRAHAIRPS